MNNRKQAQVANRLRVLRLIYSREEYSQRRIAAETHMQASTISNIIAELISSGLVVEGEARESRRVGPKETLLRINPQAACSVGINFHAAAHEICVFDGDGTLLAEAVFEKDWDEKMPARLPAQIKSLARKAGLDMAQLCGVGVSVPGVVNRERGTVILSRALNLQNYPMQEHLQSKLKLPVFVDRNVNYGSYYEQHMNPGEYWYNSGYLLVKRNRVVSLGSPYSLGLAITVNGEIYRGANYAAGELEAVGEEDAVLIPSELRKMGLRGHDDATVFFSRLGRHLASVVNLLDIGHLVVATEYASMEGEYFNVLADALRGYLIPISNRVFDIRFAENGLADLSKGAALAVLHHSLETALARAY
ncbi:ROK family protein [Ruficoccus amylovorans]|uniref:ROK family protein n=1 Tax=Ruficoccus amylovorans TaxID=1804625 RepID=A0A842H9B1_9BACT|nr:ROK family transcriptional regulator [Ruficoccus amylovorans]MBC2592910.1 ROK family protein [Ruficoccus amylovorans]